MPSIRSLRRARGLTIVELALLSDMPARTLYQIESGHQPLDSVSLTRLADALRLRPDLLRSVDKLPGPTNTRRRVPFASRRLAHALVVAIVGALLLWPALDSRPQAAARPAHPESIAARFEQSAISTPTSTASPPGDASRSSTTSEAQSRFRLENDGPHGCPLRAGADRVVITQGYDEGSHAPATLAGALDLAIDTDGDGIDNPDATRGATVLATHGGTAHVFLGSWPGGNFVRVEDQQAGWSTAYGHLDSVAVAEGQALAAGAPIGAAGDTGYATGPHLHYEVWRRDVNVNPAGLIECSAP